jgi:transcriptional regulator with XRE-family HTH domain
LSESQDKTSFAARLVRLREARQLSQKQLAARLGCPPSMISKYERGRQVPRTPEIYLQLCAALAVSPAELLGAPPAPGAPADPRLAVRVSALGERLAPEQISVLLAFLDTAFALADGERPAEAVAPQSEPL